MALLIGADGMVREPRVRPLRFLAIERRAMQNVKGLVVHQTDASTAEATFSGYRKPGANGAHFLIDKDGAIYQTASIFKMTAHVGSIRPRCVAELTCRASLYQGVRPGESTHRLEIRKAWPARYPTNAEAIGIELVGRATLPPGFVPSTPSQRKMTPEQLRGEFGIYETPTTAQNASLKWLVDQLVDTMKIARGEIFRHPVVSWKNLDEARRATW